MNLFSYTLFSYFDEVISLGKVIVFSALISIFAEGIIIIIHLSFYLFFYHHCSFLSFAPRRCDAVITFLSNSPSALHS